MSNNTIEIKINSSGTLEVVTIPVKLYKDSYKVVKLRVKAPKVEGAILKVYGSDIDEAGEEVWTTSAYTLSWKENVVINSQDYSVYEDYIPEEFCQKNGELYLTFGLGMMDGENWTSVLTSGTLNLFVSGEGFNFAGVEIPESDKLAYKINQTFENYNNISENVEEIKADMEEVTDTANNAQETSSQALAKAEQALENTVIAGGTKVYSNGVLLSEFNADTKVDIDTDQTITGKKTFEADTQITPNENTEFSVTDKLVDQRVVGNGVSLFQVNDNGTSAIKYSQDVQKTSGMHIAGDGIRFLSSGNDFENNMTLNEEGFKYNDSSVVTENNETITFAENERQKSKNLLVYPYVTLSSVAYGITFDDNGDGGILINGQQTNTSRNSAYYIFGQHDPLVLSAGTYTIGLFTDIESTDVTVVVYDGTTYRGASISKTTTFTITEEKSCSVYIQVSKGSTLTFNNNVAYPMIVKGTELGEWQPYNGEIVHEKDIKRSILYVSMLDATEVQIPANTSTIIPFAQYVSANAENKLTLSDNKIYIGKGVSKVLMSGGFRTAGATGTGGTWCAIKKNEVNVRSLPYYVSGHKLNTVPQFLFDVEEGDFIQVNIFDQTSSISIRNQGTNKETSFILEVVE